MTAHTETPWAVNNHDELVAALAMLETATRRYLNKQDTSIEYVQAMCKNARVTLSKAKQ